MCRLHTLTIHSGTRRSKSSKRNKIGRCFIGKIAPMPQPWYLKWLIWLLPVGLVALIFTLPRQQDLDRYVTADEPMYIRESAGFYAALSVGAFDRTNRLVEPAVPTMWMGALAFQRLFPDYAAPGNLDTSDFRLWTKLRNQHLTLMQILVLARLHSLRLLAFISLIGFLYARRLFGLLPALLGFWLIAFDPFLLAHSQLLASDALPATFLLAALLAVLCYAQDRKPIHMVVAGIFAGLATLSKITGVLALPFALGVWLLVEIRSAQPAGRRLWQRWLPVFGLLLTFAASAFLFWPALWTNAPQVLRELIQYAFRSAGGEINSNTYFLGKLIPNGDLGGLRYASFYPLTYLWRSTPFELAGLALVGFLWKSVSGERATSTKSSLILLLLFALFFGFGISLSSKKMDRWLMPVYPLACLAAGVGWSWLVQRVWRSQPTRLWKPLAIGLLVLAIGGQFLILRGAMPYPIAYYNPALGGNLAASRVLQTGWGEGLDLAAAFLNSQPDPASLQVYSWYAAALNLQFLGRADDLPISGAIDDEFFARILSSDYAVIYYHMWPRRTSARILDYLQDKPTVFTATVHDQEVVRVYDLRQLRQEQAVLSEPVSAP